jgi:hypothetical protein
MSNLLPNFVLKTCIVNAAMSCTVADKDRKYLRYIMIDADGFVNGTNGRSVAFRAAEMNHSIFEEPTALLLHIHQKPPKWAKLMEFVWTDANGGIARCHDHRGEKDDVLIAFEKQPKMLADQYPDLKKLYQSRAGEATDRVVLNCNDLSAFKAAFGPGVDVLFNMDGHYGNIRANPIGPEWDDVSAQMIIRPKGMLLNEDGDEEPGSLVINRFDDWVFQTQEHIDAELQS